MNISVWITEESFRRLQDGGNGSRGTVPIHASKTRTSKIELRLQMVTVPSKDAKKLAEGIRNYIGILSDDKWVGVPAHFLKHVAEALDPQ